MRRSFLFLSLLIIYGLCITSCSSGLPKDDDLGFDHLVDFDIISTISRDELVGYWNNNDTANLYIQNDITVYSITYKSVGLNNEEVLTSGAVLLPDSDRSKGVISLQHATFFADEEAPSQGALFSVVSRKAIFASYGYVVALPDYLGYGVDKKRIHPYHHASSLSKVSRDMIDATYELLTYLKTEYEDKLFLAGYSEGAYATAALQQNIEKEGRVKITASSLGSGAYNIDKTFRAFLDLNNSPYNCTPCNAFFVQSYNDLYGFNKSMDYYFNPPYAALIEQGLLLGEFTGTAVNSSLPRKPKELFTPSFVIDFLSENMSWTQPLLENSIHEWSPKFPTLLSHNVMDNVSPYFNSADLAVYNASNPNLVFLPIEGLNHFEGILTWGIISMNYFDQF